MFGLCRRESGAPLGILAFGCFSTHCYTAHDDVQQLQTDTSVWCICLQICLWFPAKQSPGSRDLWCSVLHEFSVTYHHIIRADLSGKMGCCTVSHIYREHWRACLCLCAFLWKYAAEHWEMLHLLPVLYAFVCLAAVVQQIRSKKRREKFNMQCNVCLTRLKLL